MRNGEKTRRAAPLHDESPAPGFGYRRLVVFSCAVALGAYHIFASTVMYPVPGGDAAVFMPAAINLKAGYGLTNSFWEVNPDPTGQHRFLEHPALFQIVVSACMWKSETRNAFIVTAIFNAVTLTQILKPFAVHRTLVEKVLLPSIVLDEPKTLIDS